MTGFIRFCIRRPVTVWCIVLLMVLLGMVGYNRLGVTLYPDISPAMVMVRTQYEGASPEEVEQLLTRPLEDALADLDGLKSMTSYSQDGVSLIGLELDEGLDVDLKIIDVENKIRIARKDLPKAVEEPIATKFSLSAEPFLTASFVSDLPETEVKKLIDDHIKPVLSRIEGVGQVALSGGLDREIQIVLDPAALEEHGISYREICGRIAANSTTEPSGYVVQAADHVSLRMIGEFEDLEDLENLLLPTRDGHPVPLSMLGEVRDGEKDRTSTARADGRDVIQLQVSGRANADIVKAGLEVKKEVARLTADLPELSVSWTLDDTDFVQTSVKNVIRDTGIGIALTVLVIYLFLGQVSATFIVAVCMPVAFAATFFPLMLHGYSLNLMTTLALALSMGVLVDSAILVLDNIYRYRDMGCEPFEAAEKGTAEIATSVLAGILTNLGVFLPVAMIGGLPGQMLAPYAVTILYATLIALWVTLSMIPSMAARMIGKTAGTPLAGRVLTGWWIWMFEGLRDLFLLALRKTLRYPVLTLFFFLALTVGSFAMGGNIGSESMPATDDGSITISLKLTNNVSLAVTVEKTRQLESFIQSLPEASYIEHVTATIGASDWDQALFKAQLSVHLKNVPDRPRTTAVADKIRAYLGTMKGIEYSVLATRPGFGQDPIEVHVKGKDMAVLFAIAEQVRSRGAKVPGITDLSLATEMGKAELRILPIRWRLTQLDMDIADLTQTVKGYLNGDLAGTFQEDGSEFDIKVRMALDKTNDIHTAGQLPVMTKFGVIPLEEMAGLQWSDAPTEIRRVERERTLMVTGNVQVISIGEGVAKIQEILDGLELPAGYSVRLAGEADDMEEESGEMGWTMLIAVVTTYLVIASILESWIFAAIILITVPMAAIGVIPLMLATGANMSLFAGIGIVMLIGLVVNNAIVVVDYAETLRKDEGTDPADAIEKACDVRFKPVVMGLVTSVVSFLPLALATGRGSEYRWPIAVVAIGGLIAGGFLALLAVPAAYKIYWRAKNFRFHRKSSSHCA